jgi:hypothetical protein
MITVDAEEDVDSQYGSRRSTYFGVSALESTLQEVLDSWNLSATIFVTGGVIQDCTDALSNLSEKNELAAHGFYHIPIVSLPLSSRRKHLTMLREYAKSELRREMKGFRAVRNIIDVETLALLEELEFVYDSSVLPRYVPFKSYVGFKGKAPGYPYHPNEKDYRKIGALGIWELPMSCTRILDFPLNGTWIRHIGSRLTNLLFDDEGYTNLAVHSWDFVKTKRYGYRTGKKFCSILGSIIESLYQKEYVFHTGSSLCRFLNRAQT